MPSANRIELLIMEMEYNKVAIEEKIETEYATVKKSQLDLVRQLDELTENARSTQRTYMYANQTINIYDHDRYL